MAEINNKNDAWRSFFHYFIGRKRLLGYDSTMRFSCLIAFILSCIGISPVENCAFWPISQAFAQEYARTKSFSMTIPEGFEAVPITQPHVEIALRHNKGGYPTFNILLLPHTVRDLEEPSAFANRTLESYRNVGLTKAKIEEFGWLNFGTHKACFARLSYQYNQDELQSIVAGLMLPQKELLATFVDKGPDLERNLPLMETIMNSLELLEAPANSAAEEMGYNEELRHAILLYIVLFLIIISAGGVYLLRKKHLNKSSGRFLR